MKKFISSFCYVLFGICTLSAQSYSSYTSGFDVSVPQFTPKAPNIAGLVSAIDVPVSLYTGVPDISIPIYEIDADGVRIPITLSYHASGIRVSQEASWVGLGWSLNAGGMVSRTIRCSDDFNEYASAFINEGYLTAPELGLPRESGYIQAFNSDANYLYWRLVKDSEPDIFYYSLPGASGKFLLDKSRGAVLVDKNTNIKIDCLNETVFRKYFIITTPDGNKYTFNKYEKTTTAGREGYLNQNLPNATKFDEYENVWNTYSTPMEYTSSWMLTDITTVKGRHVTFSYEEESYQAPLQESASKYHLLSIDRLHIAGPANNTVVYSCSKSVVNTWRLSQITWDGGYVTFPASSRQDEIGSMYGSAPQKLDAVRVYDNNGNIVKEADLTYTYFNNNYSGSYTHVFKRLQLQKVSNPFDSNDKYTFEYIAGSLPAKNSKNTDYWGYYNGVNQGANYYCPLTFNGTTYPGADKSANLDYMKIGTLESMTHPTKGKTTFNYTAEEYVIPGSSSTSTVTHHITKVFNVYKQNLFDTYSQYPAYKSETISITTATTFSFRGFADSETSPDLSIVYDNDQYPALRVSRINSNGTKTQVFTINVPEALKTHSGCDFPNKTLQLAAGTYLFEAIAQCKDVWFAITCEYDGTETITTNSPAHVWYGGGMRISKISGPTVKIYSYEGGKLLVDPVYGKLERIESYDASSLDYAISTYVLQLSESTIPNSTLKDGNIFGYSIVTERVGGETIKHYFYNNEEVSQSDQLMFIPSYYNAYNGLTQKTVQGGKTVEYEYEMVDAPEVKGFIYVPGYDAIYDYSYEIQWPQLKTVRTTMVENNGTTVTTSGYTYDSNFMRLTESVNNAGDTYTKRYVYPSASSSGIVATMAQKYMIGVPVETLLLLNGSVIDGRRTVYGDVSGMIVPVTEMELENTGSLSIGGYFNYLQPRLAYSNYNVYGKPMQADYQGISTVYLWSYNSTVPVAEIKNATYSQVAQLIGSGMISALAGKIIPSEADMTAINNLRNTLSTASVTTYTYQPLVGVTSITDDRGFTTYYSYDSSGRLTESYLMKSGQKRVIRKYDYHYKP